MNSKKYFSFNSCDIYITLYILYQLQDIAYARGMLNQLLQLILIIWGLFEAGKYIIFSKKHSQLIKATFLLIGMYTVYGLYGIVNPVRGTAIPIVPYLYLQSSLNSLLPILVFYRYCKNGKLNANTIRRLTPILIIIAILQFNNNYNYKLIHGRHIGSSSEEFTNNVGYVFVVLLPLIYFYRRQLIRITLWSVCMAYIVMSLKRGAIIVGILATIYFIYSTIRNTHRAGKKFIVTTVVGLFAVSGIVYLISFYNSSKYFQERIEQTIQGNTSGRDLLFEGLTHELSNDGSLTHLLFGRGPSSTVKIVGNFAHNDWLETLCNNGILGILILSLFYLVCIYEILKMRNKINPFLFSAFLTMWVCAFITTVFSMSIQSMNISQTIIIAMIAKTYNATRQHRNRLNRVNALAA